MMSDRPYLNRDWVHFNEVTHLPKRWHDPVDSSAELTRAMAPKAYGSCLFVGTGHGSQPHILTEHGWKLLKSGEGPLDRGTGNPWGEEPVEPEEPKEEKKMTHNEKAMVGLGAVLGLAAGGLICGMAVQLKKSQISVVQPGLTFDQAVSAGHGEIIQLEDGITAFRWKPSPHFAERRVTELADIIESLQADISEEKRAHARTKANLSHVTNNHDILQQQYAALDAKLKKAEAEIANLNSIIQDMMEPAVDRVDGDPDPAEAIDVKALEAEIEEVTKQLEAMEAKKKAAEPKKKFRWPWQKKRD